MHSRCILVSCFRDNIRLIFILPILALFSCGWEDTSPVSAYPDVHYAVYYFGERGIIEADYCEIIHDGESHSDSVSAKITDFVVIESPDSSYYFYSPKQGNLPDLTIRRSIEALVILLGDVGYFDVAPKRPNISAKSDVGISISGAQDAMNLTFSNELNRFVAVSSHDTGRVISSNGGVTPMLLPFVFSELGALVEGTGNSSEFPCDIAPPPDTVLLYNANSLSFTLEPLSGIYLADYEDILLDGVSMSPNLYSRLIVADMLHIYSLAIHEICDDTLFQSTIGNVESLLTGSLDPIATAFEDVLINSAGDDFAGLSMDIRDVGATHFWDPLVYSLSTSNDTLNVVAQLVVARTFRRITIGVDTLNGIEQTYSRPPFEKWAGRVPVVEIELPADGAFFGYWDTVSFVGSAFDQIDGAIAAENLVWTSSLDGTLGVGESFDLPLGPGNHMIILSAFNSDSIFGADTISITKDAGNPPVATIIEPADGAELMDSDSIEFIGSGFDVEDGELFDDALVWTSNVDGFIGTGSFPKKMLSIGEHIITLTVTDSDDMTGIDQITVTVVENTPPTVWIIMPSDGDTLSMIIPGIFAGGATDAEDGFVAAENLIWTSNHDGVIGTGFFFTTNLSSMGRHKIVLTATDSGGLSASDTIVVRVRPFR